MRYRKVTTRLLPLWALLSLVAAQAQSQPAHAAQKGTPKIFEQVGLDQKLGSQVPLNLKFTDASGQEVELSRYFGDKPVLLTLVYFECPMLCTLVLNGTVRALRTLEFSAGKEFDVLTVSINPKEGPELASKKKASYLDSYRREGAEKGWHFLTGQEDQIRQLADSVGFRYHYDPETDQFAHAAGIMILTPEGKVARYFYGVEYSPRDIQFGLMDATKEKIGSPVDQILLYCCQYDPSTGKYSFAIMSVLRIAGILTIIGIALLLFFLIRHGRSPESGAHARA